jgi:hypothetical protein
MRWLLVLHALLWASIGTAAAGREVRLTWLPSRTSNSLLRIEATAIARDVAAQVGGTLAPARSAQPLDGLARAKQLLGDGAVDEAADAYDAAIRRGRSIVLELGDGNELLRGVVARIGIALARGETDRARELATWVVRIDPGFTLEPAEQRPSVVTELAAAAKTLGERPSIVAADLGTCEPRADIVILARVTRPGEIELRRIEDCQLADPVRVTSEREHATAVRLLTGIDAVAHAPIEHDRPALYRRPWFWIAVGAVAAGATGTWLLVDQKDSREIVPRW